jgi:hypothetical protein
MSNAINTSAAPGPATRSSSADSRLSARRPDDDATIGDSAAAAGIAAGLLLAWQAALDGHRPATAAGAALPVPSGTEAALQAALAASGDADAAHATALAALQPVAPAPLQAEFRTAPGEQWQLELRRDAGALHPTLSVSAAFVSPVLASAQLPRLGMRLRGQGHAVDRLEWRRSRSQQDDAREDAE